MDLKIVLIGAASPQWGFTLTRDIIVVLSEDADLAGRRPVLVLEDIEEVVEASISGDRQLMISALERDPLLQNMDRGRIPELWDRLAAANREWVDPGLLRESR